MYKLKYKNNLGEQEVFYYNTIEETLKQMMFICEASNLKDTFKVQKEYNLRFYVTRINKN